MTGVELKIRVADFERREIEKALAQTQGDVRKTSTILAVAERSLWHKIKRHGIDPAKFRERRSDDSGEQRAIALLQEQIEAVIRACSRRSSGCVMSFSSKELAERMFYGGVIPGSPEAIELIAISVLANEPVTIVPKKAGALNARR